MCSLHLVGMQKKRDLHALGALSSDLQSTLVGCRKILWAMWWVLELRRSSALYGEYLIWSGSSTRV